MTECCLKRRIKRWIWWILKTHMTSLNDDDHRVMSYFQPLKHGKTEFRFSFIHSFIHCGFHRKWKQELVSWSWPMNKQTHCCLLGIIILSYKTLQQSHLHSRSISPVFTFFPRVDSVFKPAAAPRCVFCSRRLDSVQMLLVLLSCAPTYGLHSSLPPLLLCVLLVFPLSLHPP